MMEFRAQMLAEGGSPGPPCRGMPNRAAYLRQRGSSWRRRGGERRHPDRGPQRCSSSHGLSHSVSRRLTAYHSVSPLRGACWQAAGGRGWPWREVREHRRTE